MSINGDLERQERAHEDPYHLQQSFEDVKKEARARLNVLIFSKIQVDPKAKGLYQAMKAENPNLETIKEAKRYVSSKPNNNSNDKLSILLETWRLYTENRESSESSRPSTSKLKKPLL